MEVGRLNFTVDKELYDWIIGNSELLGMKKATLVKMMLVAIQKRTHESHKDLVEFIFDLSEDEYP